VRTLSGGGRGGKKRKREKQKERYRDRFKKKHSTNPTLQGSVDGVRPNLPPSREDRIQSDAGHNGKRRLKRKTPKLRKETRKEKESKGGSWVLTREGEQEWGRR